MGEKNADDFWDIEYSRPQRKPRPFSRDTGTVRLDFENDDAQTRPGEPSGAIPKRSAATPLKSSAASRKPTLDELLRDGVVVPGSAVKHADADLPGGAKSPDLEEIAKKIGAGFAAADASEPAQSAPGLDPNLNHTQNSSGDAADAPVSVPRGVDAWTLPADSDSRDAAIPPREKASKQNEPYLRYSPDDNRLIHEVRVADWPSPFTFYERFRSDAHRYQNHPARKCEPEPFFSFMPQYTQLNANQRAWYFWWRSLVRAKRFPAADFGYVMLYVYELINLSDTLEPASALELLCDVWLGYRAQHPRLDRYLSEWVCDLCLINRLPLPYERLKPIYPQIMAAARFKEFYAGCDKGSASPFAEALFNFNSGYDWRQSKYITDANRALFEEHIRGAFMYACTRLEHAPAQPDSPAVSESEVASLVRDNLLSSALRNYGSRLRVIRDAYSGALCSYEIKRRLEVDYSCCTRSPELRFIVTDMVKYAENNVRALIGVKSRFNTPGLPVSARALIGEYFAPLRAKPGKKAEAPPEYEKKYEAASASLSPEAALELERSSWETTNRLVSAFAENGAPSGEAARSADNFGGAQSADLSSTPQLSGSAPENEISENGDSDCDAAPDGSESDFAIYARAYQLLRTGDARKFSAFADGLNVMPETLAEKLNEYAYEIIGDIAAEPDGSGSGWSIVAEYAAELDDYFAETP